MRQISKVLARRVFIAAIVVTLVVPYAGAVTHDGGAPGNPGGQRPRLVKIVKKIVKSLGDLLSDPKP